MPECSLCRPSGAADMTAAQRPTAGAVGYFLVPLRGSEAVNNQLPVILSAAKDPGSFLGFNYLQTTAGILRCAQDDTFRISPRVLTAWLRHAPLKRLPERNEILCRI
jgi:hypothetical protein